MAADYALVATYFKLERPFDITQAYTNAFLDPAVKMP
jgi:NitT/TauT family transport system substrate-binding protein